MNERRQQNIQEYLQQGDAQARILGHIQQAWSNLAVTISKAARLFNFSESQLREWEKRGLLQTERPLLSTDGKGLTGHRQYSLGELFKLAIIRDLINQGYSPGEIPTHIDKLWEDAVGSLPGAFAAQPGVSAQLAEEKSRTRQLSINARIEQADASAFWRYFVIQALRLSLLLICEDVPDTVAGFILPFEERGLAGSLTDPADLRNVGRSLVGWLDRNGSFHLFLTDAVSFDFPTDYRLQTLKLAEEQVLAGERVLDNTFVVLERNTERIAVSLELQQCIQRLLACVYAHRSDWEPVLSAGEREGLYQVHDLQRVSRVGGDRVLNALLEQVIDLGGKGSDERANWRFCALLLPDDSDLPLQEQSLVVQAQAGYSPFQIGLTTISSQKTEQISNICVNAFGSGQIVMLPTALPGDTMLNSHRVSVVSRGTQFQVPPPGEKLHSALAVPLVGEDGLSIGVLYIESDAANAFSLHDQRVLRIISRMLEELLATSRVRIQTARNRETILASPALVDTTFSEFAIETDFIMEIDALLSGIQKEGLAEARAQEEIAFISVDLDDQSRIALKYSSIVVRNVSQQIGSRIRGRLGFESGFQPFHLSTGKYVMLLEGVTTEDARNLAGQLRDVLRDSSYHVSTSAVVARKSVLDENTVELSDVTAHLAVSSYTRAKLDELLHRYPSATAITYVRRLIQAGIEEMLETGKQKGGNCIVSWDHDLWGYKILS